MSRLTGYRPTSLSLEQAFQLLGKGPSREKLGWVADRLRESGVEVDYGDALVELALASGSSAFVALDLAAPNLGVWLTIPCIWCGRQPSVRLPGASESPPALTMPAI